MSTLPEDRVLKPLNPVPDDVNDWPDFSLREAKIFYQGKGRYADLLEASESVPLCVLGELMPLDDEQDHLNDNGKPVIWAAGKAGWFEISPSDRYLSHYNDTVEAIDLFYFAVDQHQKLPRKRQQYGFMIDPFLTLYQKHTGYRIDDDDEAMETIHKHHRFLLKQMIEEREGIDWSHTHLWKHLAETYADEVEALKASLATPAPIEEPQDSESQSESDSDSSDAESADEETTPEQQQEDPDMSEELDVTSQPASEAASSSSSQSEVQPEPIDWTKPIWDMLNILRKSSNFNMRHCGIDEAATELEKQVTFDGTHEEAVAAFERSAEPLLRLMNEAKLRKKFNWSTRRIYDELEATLADEVADKIMKTPGKLGKQKHRMKSVLRPSGARKAHKRARGAVDSFDDDEDMSDVPISSPVAKRQGPPLPSRLREVDNDSVGSRECSPSRQLNGHLGPDALPDLPPGPEAQEMLDLVSQEAKRVGRQHQTSNLQAFLGQWVV
ncbi:uncharacterized protein A1O9_11017 [Exophiala aquamarina CBS 119918]|uniref:DNA (cytosine-5)-methyltransferase 1 replication foci domain-containing protein n=1 Tax=Exophiala aquamarina CBS 119918 TaxID=1182545 RepID=A0A072NYZ3_9EURO|nr:uncharacterized protein A1O9_11017 [Exophiala aquamarina CBS 119918]KEF53109.1 hypothetical protein A1O9_11017 [Exophiala aquamarina CBS 119918]